MAARDGELDRPRFRTDRFVHTTQRDSNWYVSLRGGSMLGPFDTRREAEVELVLHMRECGIVVADPLADELDLNWFSAPDSAH